MLRLKEISYGAMPAALRPTQSGSLHKDDFLYLRQDSTYSIRRNARSFDALYLYDLDKLRLLTPYAIASYMNCRAAYGAMRAALTHFIFATYLSWPYSTFQHLVEQSVYPQDWAGGVEGSLEYES